jgi:hypothetical protein
VREVEGHRSGAGEAYVNQRKMRWKVRAVRPATLTYFRGVPARFIVRGPEVRLKEGARRLLGVKDEQRNCVSSTARTANITRFLHSKTLNRLPHGLKFHDRKTYIRLFLPKKH